METVHSIKSTWHMLIKKNLILLINTRVLQTDHNTSFILITHHIFTLVLNKN